MKKSPDLDYIPTIICFVNLCFVSLLGIFFLVWRGGGGYAKINFFWAQL